VKYDQVEDVEEDTITFNFKNTFIFRPDLSNGLTGEEIITMPHMMVMVKMQF
jgi:scavenger receptor class B, member 1